MPLPAPLLKANVKSSKKDFGHLLIIAGSAPMLGAAALCSLAAMRCGAGLVTTAVARGLNLTLQEKISNVIMTKPLAQSRGGAFSLKSYDEIKNIWDRFEAIAIGPGIGRQKGTQQLVRKIVLHCPQPLLVDADALFALSGHTALLPKAKGSRVLTPHPGEMARLIGKEISDVELNRRKIAQDFAHSHRCVLLLKGHRTIVASPEGQAYVNHSGNVGLATAGSGDVLSGMITAFLGQGNKPYAAACWGAYLHGKAADRLAKSKFTRGMIASDIIENIPFVLKNV